MSHPSYDPIWIPISVLTPQRDLPVCWKPFSDGPSVPPQFVSALEDFHCGIRNWSWAPTGIYREMAWENSYMRHSGLE